jgi:hypothetical protein
VEEKLQCHVALDDWHAALQRIRDVVAAAETYTPSAFRESVRPLWQDAHEAQGRLRSALATLERETEKGRKPVQIEDESGCVVGWQETLMKGKRAAVVSVVGDSVTVALVDTDSSHGHRLDKERNRGGK